MGNQGSPRVRVGPRGIWEAKESKVPVLAHRVGSSRLWRSPLQLSAVAGGAMREQCRDGAGDMQHSLRSQFTVLGMR